MDNATGTAPVFVPAHTVVGAETVMSLVFAHMFMDARAATLDNQANARAWNALNLTKATNTEALHSRESKNAETVDHIGDLGNVTAEQTGDTANQQTVDPIRTGTGDDIANDKASTLAAIDAAKIAGAVAGAGQAVNADSVNSNALTEQAAVLINAIARMNGLQVTLTPVVKTA